jgi:hypothetical protein
MFIVFVWELVQFGSNGVEIQSCHLKELQIVLKKLFDNA